jgi:hypothetical protein
MVEDTETSTTRCKSMVEWYPHTEDISFGSRNSEDSLLDMYDLVHFGHPVN